MSEINQEDIFFVDTAKKVEKIVKNEKSVPLGYVPVTFASGDKLSPAVLHFRDYSMGELLEITSATDDTQLKVLITKMLNPMCYEKYDCSLLHIEQIKQIMVTIYRNFWGTSLINKPYYKDLNGDLDSEDNIGYVDIQIDKLELKDIDPKFKNPFTIEDTESKKKVKFCLPTIKHIFITDAFVKEFFKEQTVKYRKIKDTLASIEKLESSGQEELARNINYDPQEKEDYEEFLEEKSRAYLRVLQAQLIESIDGKTLETIEEKLEAYSNSIPATSWIRYAETVEKFATFGLDSNYTFKVEDKPITRRFSFRLLDLVPAVEQKSDIGYSVYFDD